MAEKTKILIVGGNEMSAGLIKILSGSKAIKITAVVDADENTPAIKTAKKIGITVDKDFTKFLNKEDVDEIINTTGNDKIQRDIVEKKPKEIEVTSNHCARIMQHILSEYDRIYKARFREEERFSGIYNSSKDGIKYTDLEGRLLDVNAAFCDIVNYSKDELIDKMKYQDFTPVKYHKYEGQIIKDVIKTRHPREYEKEYIKKDGSSVPVLLTIFLVRGFQGQPIGVAAIVKNISENKRMQEELNKKLHDLERFHKIAVDRELKMIELKKTITALETKLKKKPE